MSVQKTTRYTQLWKKSVLANYIINIMRDVTKNKSGHVVSALGLIILILVIGACTPTSQSPPLTEQTGTVVVAAPIAPENDSTPEPEGTRDPQINSQDSVATASANLADAQVLDLSNPLRFDFSTYTPVPTLDWRPPPMAVPVSIRPEDHFWFARPLASDTVSWPHPFYRYGNTYFGFMRVHAGTDLDADGGTPVLAAGSGKIVWVGWGLFGIRPEENDPYGLAIAIKHDFGFHYRTLSARGMSKATGMGRCSFRNCSSRRKPS